MKRQAPQKHIAISVKDRETLFYLRLYKKEKQDREFFVGAPGEEEGSNKKSAKRFLKSFEVFDPCAQDNNAFSPG